MLILNIMYIRFALHHHKSGIDTPCRRYKKASHGKSD